MYLEVVDGESLSKVGAIYHAADAVVAPITVRDVDTWGDVID